MTEKVTIGNATLYLGDCKEILAGLNPVDCIVTSPPYDDLRVYGGHGFDFKAVIPSIAKILVQGGTCVWVVGDASINGGETGNAFRQALLFQECDLKIWDTMIYEKSGCSYPSRARYYQAFEYMFVFAKGKPKTIHLLTDRPNRWYGQKWSKKRSRRDEKGTLTESAWASDQGGEFGVRFNIWRYNTGHGYEDKIAFEHPAIMPLALARDHILSWTNASDTVLDPMCGSATTGVAALELGRKFIGIEIERKYFDLACKRLEQACQQESLFPTITNEEQLYIKFDGGEDHEEN